MPTHYLWSKSNAVTSLDANVPDMMEIVHDQTTDDVRYTGPNGTTGGATLRTLPKVLPLTIPINGGLGNGGANGADSYVFIADDAYQVTRLAVAMSVASSTGGTLAIRKCTSTLLPGSTVASQMHTATFDLTSTPAAQVGTLVGTTSTLQLAAGDRIGFDFTSTVVNAVGVATISLRRI